MENMLVPKKHHQSCFGWRCLGVLDGCLMVQLKRTHLIIQQNFGSLLPMLIALFSESQNYNFVKN